MTHAPQPLWKTCRVIAHESRLHLLWALFEQSELCVQQLVMQTGMSRPNTSNQLRLLAEHGLIVSRRRKMNVLYRAEANSAMKYAPPILQALRNGFDHSMGLDVVIRQATALSHGRRIEIVQALKGTHLSFDQLQQKTGMSSSALSRHLNKLISRRFVDRSGRSSYGYGKPVNQLGRTLIKLVDTSRS